MNDTSTWGRLVIAGGSGFLGTSLAQHLVDRGASVVVLSRGAPKIAVSRRLSEMGFDFRFPLLRDALADLLT